jgi:predicted TIM-barrel fold metal-dependent hydrolase
VREICKYNKEGLPIYIHYSLDKDNYKELENLFKDFYNIPFILCHCGIGTDNEYGFSLEGTPMESFQMALQLSKLDNVYLDISYTAAIWIYNDPSHLKLYNSRKFLLGTDTNNQQFISKNVDGNDLYKKQEKIFLNLYKDFGVWNYFNYRKIFK